MKTRYLIALLLSSLLIPACQTQQQKLQKQGIAEYKAGNYQASLDTFNQALQADQFAAENNYYAGMSAYRLGKLESAAYHLKLAWQANPGLPEVKQALTQVLIKQDKPDLALSFLERDAELLAKTKDPRWQKVNNKRRYTMQVEEAMFLTKADARLQVAETYEQVGDLDNAKIYFDQAVEMAPRDTVTLMEAGSFYARVNQKDQARKLFQKAHDIDPKTPGLAEAMTKAGFEVK